MTHFASGTERYRRLTVPSLVVVTALIAIVLSPLAAQAQSAAEPIQVTGAPVLVSGGPDNQTDPHISDTLVSYTKEVGIPNEIRYYDLVTGSDAAIPNDGHNDGLSDVHGSTIVFRRIYTDGSTGTRPVMALDTTNPEAGPVELDLGVGDRRSSPAIGGRTVAWTVEAGGVANRTDVVAYDLDSGQTTRLTTDGTDIFNGSAAVSFDGAAITWSKCLANGTGCDIYAVRKSAEGTWGAAIQLTDSTSQDILPGTNGQIVTYASDVGGDFDIRWKNIDGTGEQQLTMSGRQSNPNISGNLISFESEAVGTTNADLFVYDLATDLLYQVTNTPDVDEMFSDISVGEDGMARVVWAQPDGLQMGHNDIYATSFELADNDSAAYEVCPLFDESRPFHYKSIVLIPLQLCDEQGENLSSRYLVLTATELVKPDGTSPPATVKGVGNLNPDGEFRYIPWLGKTGGYAVVLNTRALSPGTWELRFTVSGDPTTYSVAFDLR